MKCHIAAFVSLVMASGVAVADDLSEQWPLRKLIIESEYIAIGHVVGIEKMMNPDNSFGATAAAKIRILEVLKGTIKEEIVEVAYSPGVMFPASPRFETGTDVLLFLDRRNDRWYTHASSHGAKTLPAPDMSVYRSRIVEMQRLLLMQDSREQLLGVIEWLVKCAEHPATRWEGTYELSPESDFMLYYNRCERRTFESILSQGQRERLKITLFKNSQSDYSDLGLADLVYRGNEQEVHRYLLNSLKSLPQKDLFVATDYMERLLRGKSTPEMKQLIDQFATTRLQTRNAAELRSIVERFVSLAEY